MDGVAYLVQKLYSNDSIGQKIPIGETKQEIYVSTGSINRNEWFNAGRNGMNPEILLTTPFLLSVLQPACQSAMESAGVSSLKYGARRERRVSEAALTEPPR